MEKRLTSKKVSVGMQVRSATQPAKTGVVTWKSQHNAGLWVRWSDGDSQLVYPYNLVAL